MKETRLEKHRVCDRCFCEGMIHADCYCVYDNKYKVIELEFEVCKCCGQMTSDGDPADTEFNKEQIKNHEPG